MAFASQGDLRRKRVTSAEVSTLTDENSATAGDTHEELQSAIAQTEDSDVSGETLQYLSENIGKYWRAVGRKLNLTDGQLDNLDIDYRSNHQEKVYQMLLVWKRGTAATYDVLADALKSAGRADLLREITRNPFGQHVATNLKEMKEDTKEVRETQTSLSVRREFEEGSVTSADKVPIHTGININKDGGDSHSLRAESIIGKDGGTLEIPNTGVSLEIPPGALRRDYFVQMRIIPHHYLDETELSFASNSSVVVELLPNNVELLRPATLTLPHCLVLKKKCRWKAKVYSSHPEEGTRPQWEEEINTQCELTHQNCVMRLNNFSWKKVEITGPIVEAKKIVLYVAKHSSSTPNVIYLDVGYYWRLPSCQQEISFNTVAITEESFCTFVLNKMASDETDQCTCYFKAGQGSDNVELIFPLMESSLSRAEATILSTGNGTADSQEELPPAISQTKVRKRLHQESSLSRAEATILSTENGTADSQEELPPAISQTKVLKRLHQKPSAEAIISSTGNDTADLQEELPSAISKTRVRNNFLQDLSENIGKCWMDVGRKLQLTEEQLENLEQKGYPTLKETIYQMLLVWKRKRGRAATYDVLADAWRKAGRVDLQEELLEKYQPT